MPLSALLGFLVVVWLIWRAWPLSLIIGSVVILGWIMVARRRSNTAHTTRPSGGPSGVRGITELKAELAARRRARAHPVAVRPIASPGKDIIIARDQSWLDEALRQLPKSMLERSGSLFYSGQEAFSSERALYILGLNPGGSPLRQVKQTVARDITDWRAAPARWSAYLDESWEGKPAGTHGMQPRIRHMFDELGLDLRETPASNVVFVRSNNEAALTAEKTRLLGACWPIHAAIINNLGITTVLCLGTTSGRWVRDSIGAHRLIDSFSEVNGRGWTSQAHLAEDGRAVVTVTHPGRADWRNPAADPTPLVRAVLNR